MAVTQAALTFFERESWPSHERPYELLFQPPNGTIPVCNYNVVQVPNVPVHNLRPLKDKLSLDHEGFLVALLDTTMEYDDYFDHEKLKCIYMTEIKTYLKKQLGVRAAYIHECVVSFFFTIDSSLDGMLGLSWVDTTVGWERRPFW